MIHQNLINQANNALDRLYADVTVSKATTLFELEVIIEDLKMRCEALRDSMEKDKS